MKDQTHSYIQEPYKLKDLIDTTKLVQKFLPKQTDIDKILDIIKRKVLKGTHLPLTIKEIQAGYLTSPYFKGPISIPIPKQIAKQKVCYKESRNPSRRLCSSRFINIQIGDDTRQRSHIIGNT